jgi:hypothetical protein
MPTMSKPQRLLVPIILCCASFAQVAAQTGQHPPPLEQCRLDVDTYKKLGNFSHPTEAEFKAQVDYLDRFPLSEISRRIVEMESCMEVDRAHQKDYADVSILLEAARGNRYQNFLVRHDLWNQFVGEDAQGKR